jgi:hypothetical protein
MRLKWKNKQNVLRKSIVSPDDQLAIAQIILFHIAGVV